ncbi:MAG: hypothetical protein HY422_02860 [Candidatus Komeilibacteria bacterium]|nr:hypothetical protein [Candidatus Komeilibacteria bacterium]
MNQRPGFSILEIITSLAIFALILGGIAVFQLSILQNSKLAESRSSIDQKSLIILRNFATELRAAQTPYDGSFALANTDDDSVLFYADINGDSAIERIRYSVESGILYRGVIPPSGEPLTYDPANESVASLIDNIIAAPPYFIYYGAAFDGSTTSPALTQPVSPSDVRLVEMRLQINPGVSGQTARMLETRAMIRSLKNK